MRLNVAGGNPSFVRVSCEMGLQRPPGTPFRPKTVAGAASTATGFQRAKRDVGANFKKTKKKDKGSADLRGAQPSFA
jgi:hypothetical protein